MVGTIWDHDHRGKDTMMSQDSTSNRTRASYPEYFVWRSMRERCRKRNLPLEDSWDKDFFNFLSDIGARPSSEYSIDRIIPEKGYVNGNCRWADATVQSRNRKVKGGPHRKKTRSPSYDPITGEKRSPVSLMIEYIPWMEMRQRCQNPKHIMYTNYGDKGIEVCSQWEDFWQFLKDVGSRPSKDYSLDRLDPFKNYEPENVRWATRKEQAVNRKYHKKIEWNGESLLASQWAERTGLDTRVIYSRIFRYGWDTERALTTPSKIDIAAQKNDWASGVKIGEAKRRGTTLTCREETLTLSEWGGKLGLNSETIRKRLKAGMTPEEALFKKPEKHGIKREGIKGRRSHLTANFREETKSLVEWAKQFQINLTTLHYRLNKGWSIEKALTTPPRIRQPNN
jgi:hypothetical protein